MEEGFYKGLSCLFYNAREFVWVCVFARASLDRKVLNIMELLQSSRSEPLWIHTNFFMTHKIYGEKNNTLWLVAESDVYIISFSRSAALQTREFTG